MDMTSNGEDAGSIPDLAQRVKDPAFSQALAQVTDIAQILSYKDKVQEFLSWHGGNAPD